MQRWIKIGVLLTFSQLALANDLISAFPMESYNQNVASWIKPTDIDYDNPLLSKEYQQQRYAEFYQRYYASSAESFLSPWGSRYVNLLLSQSENQNILTQELQIITEFKTNHLTNPKKIAYGENYRPYDARWFAKISANMDLAGVTSLKYSSSNRAIAVDNLFVRTLPTMDPLFYSSKIAGEGYPFDNLQETALFIGMPLYIIKQSLDKEWSLVIASDDIGWVKTAGLARVNAKFIQTWQKSAKAGVIAITQQSALVDKLGSFRAMAYNGMSLPLSKQTSANYEALIPVANLQREAQILPVLVSKSAAAVMPLTLTPHNIANIMQSQIGKPYGWGGMFFDYDCSAETKALFTPFGIYLPRNSQFQSSAGKTVVLDQLSSAEREQYLIENGHKLLTLVQIPGHIMLYIGNYANPNSLNHETIAMSYQNIWGLRTRENNSRAVLGGAVIFPLLSQYPEDQQLLSFYDQAARSKFRLIYLDQVADK